MDNNENREQNPGGVENKEQQGRYINRMRGLYGKIKIPVKYLNIIIIVLCVALVACMAYGIANRGFVITLDSQGGTAVTLEGKYLFGQKLEIPEEPTREGYTFTGWYRDRDCTVEWDLENDTVAESMTLYAGWEEK